MYVFDHKKNNLAWDGAFLGHGVNATFTGNE